MKMFEIADEKQPLKALKGTRKQFDIQKKLEIVGFEILNEFIRAVTESAERTKEKVRDNERW